MGSPKSWRGAAAACSTPKRASAAEIRRAAGGNADLTEQGPMGTELGTMGDAGDDGVRSAERL